MTYRLIEINKTEIDLIDILIFSLYICISSFSFLDYILVAIFI